MCVQLEQTWAASARVPEGEGVLLQSKRGGGGGGGHALGGKGGVTVSVSLTRRQFVTLLTFALAISDRCRKKHIKVFFSVFFFGWCIRHRFRCVHLRAGDC